MRNCGILCVVVNKLAHLKRGNNMNTKCEYLTEAKLGEIIDAWAEATDRVVIRQFSLYNKRLKYDFFVRDKELTEGATVFFVEFDGDTHFRDAQVMERDKHSLIRDNKKPALSGLFFYCYAS